MQIDGLSNTLDKIALSSEEIENQIKSYRLTFSQIRRNDVEWGMKFPMFVPPFYSYILKIGRVPNQKEYWNNYIFENKPFFNASTLTSDQMAGLEARVFRTYPSLVRDLHLGVKLKKSGVFNDVYYNEVIDIQYGIDLVVLKNDKLLGLNLFTNTRTALHARVKKEYRPKKPVNFKCIEIPIEFRGSKVCGDFFLYSEREIEIIKGEILNHV